MQSQNLSASPATSLPRHSRGLDFSRASSTLHHTTIADSEPPSSPVMQKGMAIPPRKGSMSSMMLDSPNTSVAMGGWATLAPERSTVSSSVGSVNMIGSDSESSDSDEDASMCDDQEDPVYTTPQVHKLQNPSVATPFAISGCGPQTPGGGQWGTGAAFSPAQASLMKTMRGNKVHKTRRKSRKSSSSASNSGYSSMASPRTASPPPLRSIEGAGTNGTAQGYFAWAANAARSRRESLALGTDGMHLSSGNDSGDEACRDNTAPSTPGVVRRPVTRRGNLLPKTKGYARIRAALMEEAAPVDTEIRRESETMTQVRERDSSVPDLDLNARPGTATAASSPNLLPAVPESAQEDFGHEALDAENTGRGRSLGMMNFAAQASRSNSGTEYWNRMNSSMRTPPPPNFGRHGSSAMSDVNMESPAPGGPQSGNSIPDSFWRHRPRARSSASDASEAMFATANSAVNDDVVLKKFKRRREDDFDIATIKRRAVSPGMSAQNSPVLTHSPPMKGEGGIWGHPPEKKGGEAVPNGRSNSGGSNGLSNGGTLLAQGKKLGLQGMVDTNDGLMHMSLE
ncbi:hypothetical protein EJ03DRAFT_266890 [Teratosphaeria nubilosa]|uniref:Uncharacterized protein n=1 Tax=Teratosphaeria nubilosa TaxID=161662 RepID=A0A6G1LHR2_9PEZI|nr:hypothetical protein EJ03DRAFT_266890 [Teratosphaeria nubilosa]